MVVWKEVGEALSRRGAGRGEGSCQVSIFRAEALGTGESTTVGGMVESDTSSRARGPGLRWKVGARKGRGRGGASRVFRPARAGVWVRLAKGPPDTALPGCDQELPGAASTLKCPLESG